MNTHFNQDQVTNLIQSVGKIGGAILGTYGATAPQLNVWATFVGYGISGVAWWFSHHSNAAPAPPADDQRPPGPTPIAKAAVVLAFGLFLSLGSWGCSTSAVTNAYKAESATDTSVTAAWTLWNSYLVNSKIAGNAVPLATQTAVSAAFNKVKALELVAIDATSAAAQSTNGTPAMTLAMQNIGPALTDLGNILAQFNIKL